jgi:hypothetical protein
MPNPDWAARSGLPLGAAPWRSQCGRRNPSPLCIAALIANHYGFNGRVCAGNRLRSRHDTLQILAKLLFAKNYPLAFTFDSGKVFDSQHCGLALVVEETLDSMNGRGNPQSAGISGYQIGAPLSFESAAYDAQLCYKNTMASAVRGALTWVGG